MSYTENAGKYEILTWDGTNEAEIVEAYQGQITASRVVDGELILTSQFGSDFAPVATGSSLLFGPYWGDNPGVDNLPLTSNVDWQTPDEFAARFTSI